jgi:hypothetical protein
MSYHGIPIEDSPGWEIYSRWVAYSVQEKVIPDAFTFYEKVLVGIDHFPMTRGGFRHWLARLQVPPRPRQPPYVWRDPVTNAWCLRDVDVREK